MRFVHPYRSTLTRLACLSAAIVLPAVAGSTPAPQDSCAPLADQAAAATGLSDADAKAGLAQAESLITRAAAAGCPLAGLRAQAARGDNLLTLGRYQEAEDVYQQLSKTLDPGGPSILLAGVLRRLGAAYYFTGELDRALQQYRASIGVAQKIGDRMDVAKAQGDIGALYVQIGWLDEARQAQEEALAGYQEVQWKPGIAGTANNMSQVDGGMGDRALASGDDAAARTHYAAMYHAARQAFQEFQDLHNTRGIAVASANVGIAAAALGHYHEAIGWHRRAPALRRRIADAHGQGTSLATTAGALRGRARAPPAGYSAATG